MNAFKAYDIRGKFPFEVDEALAYKIGRAFVLFSGASRIVVGRDNRLSSPVLARALIKGVCDQGADVIDIGVCSTPMVYFASKTDHAVMVTASHLPKEYNGFKLTKKGVLLIGENNGLRDIEEFVEKNVFPRVEQGRVFRKSILASYVKHVLRFRKRFSKFKVVIDGGNGVAGSIVPHLFKNLPFKYVPLCFELDGTYPNHVPNPALPENVTDLQRAVVKHKADLGIAYDGDCDRVVFVDEKGNLVRTDISACLMLDYFKQKLVVHDVTCSRVLRDVVRVKKGKGLVSRVGHTFVEQIMRQKKAVFGVELSGHFYFRDNFSADSADIAVIVFLSVLSQKKLPLSKLVQQYKGSYVQSGTINMSVDDKLGVLKRLSKEFKGRQSWIDGLTVEFDDWWFNVRPSNTESLMRVNVEARNHKLLQAKVKDIRRVIGV